MSLRPACLLAVLWSAACGNLVGTADLPAGSQGPNAYNTPSGALSAFRGTLEVFQTTFPSFIVTSGLFTDELTAAGLGKDITSVGGIGSTVDARLFDGSSGSNTTNPTKLYGGLQQVRGNALETMGLLATYAPDQSPALRGELSVFRGYAELLLAELYCSGVPLSTLDFQGDFTYKPGSAQQEVYAHALALFDSALAISSDSASIINLASVLKGRVLLDLDSVAQAAQAVTAVPTAFQYQFPVSWTTANYPFSPGTDKFNASGVTIATNEGENGLPFTTSSDPRAPVTPAGSNRFGVPLFTPAQYPVNRSSVPIVLASGIEARLIEAEAALNANPNDPAWLNILNVLRTTCTDAASCPSPAPAGTGGVAGLPPLSDPGSSPGDTARVNLLFTERAYWLFLTGHRQGDLRRLVRNYGRPQDAVYPTGPYFGGNGRYGSEVSLPIPSDEQSNPFFHGCLSQGA
jgi:hypothetical protein